jgi:outer membrane protein OmpA-like peptidoglycan-associated protein
MAQYSNAYFMFAIFFFNFLISHAQDIVWADKVLKSTPRFEYQDNDASHALGVPFMYQGVMNEVIDPFTEGYIINNEQVNKLNIIQFSFPRVVGAEQLVLGGIFNLGVIRSVKIIDLNKAELEVYRMTKGSVSKFHNFNIYFEPISVVAIKIEIDHSKVNQWNLIKGIGLAETTDPVNPFPDIYDADEFYGKEKINLSHENSECMVFSPKISHDAKTLYLVEECPGDDDQDIWVSKFDSLKNTWSASQKAGFPLNNKGHNFVASVGEDDKFILLGNAYNDDGSNAGDGVSIAHRKKDGSWSVPRTISIPGVNNKNEHANFYLSGNEKIMLMSLQNPDSKGALDLYASFYNDKTQTWSEPKNLGSGINTLFAEDSPCLADDNRTLFFSSKGYVGFGGFDLYVTERLDDSWTYWSKPKNLGPLVNSKTDDYGFSISSDGKYGFYNNVNFENDSLHLTDIYKVNLPKTLIKEPKIEFKGKISSAETNEGIDALVRISNENGTMQSFYNSSGKNGAYELSVPIHQKYVMTIENDDFYKHTVELSLDKILSNPESLFDFNLKPLPDSGFTVNLNNISFVKGKPEVSSLSGAVLDSLIVELTRNPLSKIEIGVHTDSNGDPIKNKQLTQERAKSITNYMIAKGISTKRIYFKGYGSEKPLLTDNSTEDKAKSRRVTVTYLGRLKPSEIEATSQ